MKAVLASPASSLVDSLSMDPWAWTDLGAGGWGGSSLACSLNVLLWGMSPVDPKLESLQYDKNLIRYFNR